MKIGVCRGLDDFEAIKSAASAGVDYLECGFGNLAKFDDDKFNECKTVLESLSLPCYAANGFIPGELNVVGNNIDYQALSEYIDKGFHRAELLGVKKIVFGSGKSRSFPEGFSLDKAKAQLAYFLSEYAGPRAEKAGCIIVMEPLRFCESSMIHTVADGIEIASMSGCKNVFGLADLYHVYGNSDSIEGIKVFKNLVKHAHIAEPVKRKYPNDNDADEIKTIYKLFINSLKEACCDSLSIEAGTDDFQNEIGPAVSYLKKLI